MNTELLDFVSSPSNHFKEFKNILMEINAAIKQFSNRIGRKPEGSLIRSILTNMLDPESKQTFINEGGVIVDFDTMKNRIIRLAAEPTSDPMEVGALDPQQAGGTGIVCPPCSSPLAVMAPTRTSKPCQCCRAKERTPEYQMPDMRRIRQSVIPLFKGTNNNSTTTQVKGSGKVFNHRIHETYYKVYCKGNKGKGTFTLHCMKQEICRSMKNQTTVEDQKHQRNPCVA